MIDFQEMSFINLRKVDYSAADSVQILFVDGEEMIGCYKGVRDYLVFTNKRIICVNAQGMMGKKRAVTSLPYAKIIAFTIETAGVFDIDSELELYFSGLGHVKFEFSGANDIVEIGKYISSYVL